jgi:hypothetical protein
MPNWTNTTYTNINNILHYIYEDYMIDYECDYYVYSIIYNNIQLVSDSNITQSTIIFKYIENQININDFDLIKKTLYLAF